MPKEFNITGLCNPEVHYMVNLDSRLDQIKKLVDNKKYFTINRGRQYGKTTTLKALKAYLSGKYIVVSLDFQVISSAEFQTEQSFVKALARELYRLKTVKTEMNPEIQKKIKKMRSPEHKYALADLFSLLSDWCEKTEKPVVLLIDEVDSASNNQIFLDFLGQLRWYYLNRDEMPIFQSVILAGVHDIRHLKQKISPDSEHKHNSPWNIATDFNVEMSFFPEDIAGMLSEYEADYRTGMNIPEISQLIYDYTSGYPVLVSNICKIIDEKLKEWNRNSVVEAVGQIISGKSMLFESLMNKLEDYPELKKQVYRILLSGEKISYNPDSDAVSVAMMYGFIRVEDGSISISNRIFETRLYNAYLTSDEMQKTELYQAGDTDKPDFIVRGKLNMEFVLEKFISHYADLYGDSPEKFKENDGRKLFLLYLRPIINGTGHFYVEAQTRNKRRTDVIVDYAGEQHIIELKIWHGEKYNEKGEKQLSEYLDYHHLKKGYLVIFNFNQNKQTGIQHVAYGDKDLVEVII